MVAGATGIDLFLLVIDAAEGARPQTHEHLAILRLLGIEHGVVAVTKADAVDAETLELARRGGARARPRGGGRRGQRQDRRGARRAARRARRGAAGERDAPRTARPASTSTASFTLRGIGTVVTGTLWSGTIGEGDELRVEPAGLDVRVRSVQVHDRAVDRAEAGQRVAVALPGIERDQISRGDALVAPGAYPVTYRLDVALEELGDVPAAVTVHLGTADVPARVARKDGYAQLRLERPVVAARGDRVVLRAASTVGGGVVLDPLPPRRLDPERLERLESWRGERVRTRARVVAQRTSASWRASSVQATGSSRPHWLEELRADVERRLAAADPRDPGIDPPSEPWAAAIVPLLGLERRGSRLYAPGAVAQRGRRRRAPRRARAARASTR